MSETFTSALVLTRDALRDLPDDPALLKQVIAQLQTQLSPNSSPSSDYPAYPIEPSSLESTPTLISYGFLEQIIDSIPDPVFVKNRQHQWILVNQAYCQLVGRDRQSIINRFDQEVLPEEKAELAWVMDEHIFVTDEEDVSEDYSVDYQGNSQYLSTKKMCLQLANGEKYIIGTIRDLTQHKQAESALRQAQNQAQERTQELQQTLKELQRTQLQLIQNEKMSSLGQLVAGLAHELNNPMTFIQGNLEHGRSQTDSLIELIQLYREELPDAPLHIRDREAAIDLDYVLTDLPRIFTSAESGSQRIQSIIESLKVFSRLDESDRKVVDIHEGLNSILLLLQSRLKFKTSRIGINVICDYGALPPIECYAGALNQVFMNLLMNAIDAIDTRAAQIQSIATEAGLDPYTSSFLKQYKPMITIRTALAEAGWINIHMSDNGTGIAKTIESRIFDPFFTTKPIGKGTGMGLTLTYQIITEQHGGQIRCESAIDRGTEFNLTIPIKLAA
jgi:two-component system, NtrC family, sensor kinase